jgi:FkbM family methyltransferase
MHSDEDNGLIPRPLAVPVACFVHNRPEATAIVLARIRAARPRQLLVVGEGPKAGDEVDAAACRAVRQVVEEMVDWPCEVRTEFAETRQGWARRMVSGLEWVFFEVEEAVILEVDWLPDVTFFSFCEELLKRYRRDERVMGISGSNFQEDGLIVDQSYYFSRCVYTGAWATWRRAWKHYDQNLSEWPNFRDGGGLARRFEEPQLLEYWKGRMDRAYVKPTGKWDLQWMFACWKREGAVISPVTNLAAEWEGGARARMRREGHPKAQIAVGEIVFPLRHPEGLRRNATADAVTEGSLLAEESITYRVDQFFRQLRNWRDAPRNSRSYRLGLQLRLLALGERWRDGLWLVKPGLRYHLARIGIDFRWTSAPHVVAVDLYGEDLRIVCRDDLCDVCVLAEVFGEERYSGILGMGVLRRVMDLSANIGAFTLYVQSLHPAAEVLCVESDPRNVELLRRNLSGRKVEVLEAAVIPDGAAATVSLQLAVDRTAERLGGGDEPETVRLDVQGRTFSSLLAAVYEAEVDLVRVDIVGAEAAVLSGTPPHLLCRVRNFLIEYHSTEVRGELRRLFRWDFEVQSECLIARNHGLVHFRRSARSRRA